MQVENNVLPPPFSESHSKFYALVSPSEVITVESTLSLLLSPSMPCLRSSVSVDDLANKARLLSALLLMLVHDGFRLSFCRFRLAS